MIEDEVKRQLDILNKQQENDWEKYQSLLPETEEIELIVLKGHLIIEVKLYKLATELCYYPKHLESARLSFKQLSLVARSLIMLPIMDKGWEAITVLNSLRNKLSHNLEPENIDRYVENLVNLCALDKNLPKNFNPPDTPSGKVKGAIAYIIGQLSIVTVIATFLKKNQKLK